MAALRNPRYHTHGVEYSSLEHIEDPKARNAFSDRIRTGDAHSWRGDWYSTVADLPIEGRTEHKKKTDSETALRVDFRSIPKVNGKLLSQYGTRDHMERWACAIAAMGPDGLLDCRHAASDYNDLIQGNGAIQPESFLRKLNDIPKEVTARWREVGEGMGVDRSSLTLPGRPAYVQRNGSKLKAGNGGRKRKPEEPSPEAGSSSSKRRKPEEPSPELDPVMLKAEFSCGLA